MTHNEIRRAILELLRDKAEQIGSLSGARIGPDTFLSHLNIPEKSLNFNIEYLEKQEYVKTIRSIGCMAVSITPCGLDVVSDPFVFNQMFPVNQQINITNSGTIGAVGTNIQLNNSFNTVTELVGQSSFSESDKQEFLALLTELLEALPKKTADPSKLTSFLTNLLDKAGETAVAQSIPILIKAVQSLF